MAGLGAARQLAESGRQVLVLEARDRVGGRVHTDRSWGAPIELGAQWIHGGEGNAVRALVEGAGRYRTEAASHEPLLLFDEGGRSLRDEEARAMRQEFTRLLSEAKDIATPDDVPLADAVWAVAEGSRSSAAKAAARWGLAWLQLIMGVGCEGLSARHWDQDVELPGPDRTVVEGYDAAPKILADGLNVRFGEQARRIEVGSGVVCVRTVAGAYEAEAVVVTLPLGVLKRERALFAPSLPPDKQAAIEALGMGVLDKVVLRFSRCFWPEGCAHFTWSGDGRRELAGFTSFAGAGCGPVLVAWAAGRQARSLEPLADDVVVGRVLASLRRRFGAAVPDPVTAWVTRWASDPFACGSYSHLPPGSDGSVYDAIAAPVGGRLFFAGEHTSRAHPATTHGAYLSGMRAAREVIEAASGP